MSEPSPVRAVEGVDRQTFEGHIRGLHEPVVLQGLVGDWPLVEAARRATIEAASLLKSFDAGFRPQVVEAGREAGGRIFYDDDLSGFNFARRPAGISEVIDRLLSLAGDPGSPTLFLESVPANRFAPAFARAHPMPLLGAPVEPRLWIGNAVTVNTHFDLAYNIACVAVGKRRFTLFPPDEIANLYVAPFDFTPSGAPVSLVQLTRPDFARFPRFARALERARVAILEPGDAIYIPYGWWHHVESLGSFNVLVNYWWNEASQANPPQGALLHSLLAIRDLPADQRAVWASLFEQLVFADPERALAHLPTQVRGMFGPPSPQRARDILGKLLRDLRTERPE